MWKYLVLISIFLGGCAHTNPRVFTTPNGITLEETPYPITADRIDWLYIHSLEVMMDTLGGGDELIILKNANRVHLHWMPFGVGVAAVWNTQSLPAIGDQSNSGLIRISLRNYPRNSWRSIYSMDCLISHEFIHWLAYQMGPDVERISVAHAQPLYGPGSVSDRICKEVGFTGD